LINDQV